MKKKLTAAVGSLLISGVLAGAAVMPAASSAGGVGIQAQLGQVCNVDVGWPGVEVWANTSFTAVLYYVGSGDGFRIVAYGANNTYYGHGNGKADGYLGRDYINQSSCHW